MKKIASVLLAILTVIAVPIGVAQNGNVQPTITVAFLGQAHQTISAGCYDVQVNLNITSTLTRTFTIAMDHFFIFESGTSLTIQNQPYWTQANNTLLTVILFPNNPIILTITFHNFCPINVSNLAVNLFYENNVITYEVRIFP